MLEAKRSDACRWGGMKGLVLGAVTCCGVAVLAGCGGGLDVVVPTMDDLIDPNHLKYEAQNLTPAALEERMREVDEFYAEPRFFGKVLASYETSLKSISERNGYAALWRGARACAWIALDPTESASRRGEFALKGMAMGKEAVKKASTLPESFYYYALSLGALCDLKKDASRELLHRMRDNMKVAAAIDEKYDYCGPLRFLGELMIKTDPYPTYAVGTLEQGMAHLKRAVELCPEYGENHLVYARALADDGQADLARAELEKVMVSPKPRDRSAEHDAWLELATTLMTDLQGK